MSLETSAIKLCNSLGIALNSAAPQEIKKTVNRRAVWGGIVLAIPLFGLDSIIYAIILWGMYSSVAKIAGIKFGAKLKSNILGGFIVNVAITLVVNFFADWIAVFGWIGMFFVGYFATKYSGILYLSVLELFHNRNKMKVRLDYQKMGEAFQEAGGKGAVKGVAKSGAVELGETLFQ